ncbi:MAG: M20 family metallopeptidase [Sedimentisphaerales bacterium]|nr:M20 family metallopeptidase [Sedimentisphaerales bacterium]
MAFSEVVELARALVAIASVSPQDRIQWSHPYGEEAIAQYVHDWFVREGLNAEFWSVAPGRPNVVVQAEGQDRTKTLLLSAHLDTVDVQGMTIDPFDPVIKDGRLYGRGSCDTKGCLAAMMIAVRDRIRAGRLPHNIVFLASCGEEHNMLGARRFAVERGDAITGAIFGEPTGLSVVVAHKGVARLTLSSSGRTAHSSAPHLGQNAIYPLARAISLLEQYGQSLSEAPGHQRLGCETLTVTMVNGGQQANVVPDSATAWIDWRLLPGHSAAQGRDELAEFLKQHGFSDIDVMFYNEYGAMETDEDAPLVLQLRRTVEHLTGNSETTVVPYATDASAFGGLGIATVVFGPGDIRQAHTPDEFIELKALEQGLAAYSGFLANAWFE